MAWRRKSTKNGRRRILYHPSFAACAGRIVWQGTSLRARPAICRTRYRTSSTTRPPLQPSSGHLSCEPGLITHQLGWNCFSRVTPGSSVRAGLANLARRAVATCLTEVRRSRKRRRAIQGCVMESRGIREREPITPLANRNHTVWPRQFAMPAEHPRHSSILQLLCKLCKACLMPVAGSPSFAQDLHLRQPSDQQFPQHRRSAC